MSAAREKALDDVTKVLELLDKEYGRKQKHLADKHEWKEAHRLQQIREAIKCSIAAVKRMRDYKIEVV